MTKKKRPLGRPPRKPGRNYTIRDIPTADYVRFRARCRSQKPKVTIRQALIRLIAEAAKPTDSRN